MRVICNSIPKSGTYLLAALAKFAGQTDQNLRFVDGGINIVDDHNNMVDYIADTAPTRLDRLDEGSFAPSHLTFSTELESHLLQGNFKTLFIYRHPGDVLYSYVRFVTYSKSFYEQSAYNRELQDRMKAAYATDEDRVIAIFENMQTMFHLRENAGWLSSAACHPIRFEALYPELLSLQAGSVGPVLSGIFDYLGVDGHWTATSIYNGVYGQGPTFMEGRDKIGQFQRLDEARMRAVFDDPEFVDMLRLYGYDDQKSARKYGT